MEELLQDRGFRFCALPAVLSGSGALARLPYELYRRNYSRPLFFYSKGKEGTSLKKAAIKEFMRSQLPPPAEAETGTADAEASEFDAIIALGGGKIQEEAKQLAVSRPDCGLFSVLSDIQNCREAGPGNAGRFPDAVFLDPRGYQQADPVHSARSAVTALVMLVESLQRDRVNSLILSHILTGIQFIERGAQDLSLLPNRHAAANGNVAAALVYANAGEGAVISAAELFQFSGFSCLPQASAALLPFLIRQMEQLDEPALAEAGGSERLLNTLNRLKKTAHFEQTREPAVVSLISQLHRLLSLRHAPDIRQLLRTINEEND